MRNDNLLQKISLLISYALPMIATGMINMVSSFVSMKMVAQISRSELAAGALSVTTFITIMTVAVTIFFAVGILISHQRGQAKSFADTGKVVKNGIWMALFLFIPSAIAMWNVDKVLLLFGEDKALVDIARGYFHFASPGMLPMLLMTVLTQFYAGTGRPNFSTVFATLALPLSVCASYTLILGHFGFAQLGLAGITAANLIAQSTVLVVIFAFLHFSGDMKKYHIFSGRLLPDIDICKSIFSLGLPIGLQYGGEIAAMAVSTYLLGYFGIIALSSAQIVSQYVLFVVMITLGISQALSLLTSEAYGRKDIASIKEYLKASFLILSVSFVGVWFVFLEIPEWLINLFVGKHVVNSEIIFLVKSFFKVSCILLLFDGLRNMLTGTLRGIHDSKAPMRIGIASLWLISLPACYIIGFTLNGGPIGQRIGFTTGFIICTIWLMLRFKQKYKLLEDEIGQEALMPTKEVTA